MQECDLKALAALERVYSQAQDYGFKPETINKLANDMRLDADNKLIDEILSVPKRV